MSMKVYPIIYGRTKYVDYLPDFLIKPYDLETKDAFCFVSAAMEELEPFKEIRYCVFSTNTYVIAGVACYLNDLAKICSIENAKYVRDATGRQIAGFVGVALKKEDGINLVPNINEQYCWTIYNQYIAQQWNYPCDVNTVLLYERDLIEIEKCEIMNELRVIDEYEGKIIVENIDIRNMAFLIREVCLGRSKGYISSINKITLLTRIPFEYASVTNNVLLAIRKNREKVAVSNRGVSNKLGDTAFSKLQTPNNVIINTNFNDIYQKEKGHSFLKPLWVMGAIIGGGIILLLIIM